MNVMTEHFGFVHSGLQVPRASGSAIRNRSAGFTLVELMVSIAILTAIILIVSTLLDNAQRAVKLSQGTITADADARTVVERMRADLASLTNEGFLAIYTDTGDRQHLVFTAVGSYKSMIDSTIANAARIDYGRIESTGSDNNVLWRRAMLLNAESTATTANDHEKISLADYKVLNRSDIDSRLAGFTNTPVMTLPPGTLADLEKLWPYLAEPCTNLKIDWTDGELDTNDMLLWYNSVTPKAAAWTGRNAAYQDTHPSDNDAMEYAVGGRYCALWTYRKKDNWPLALRITFTLGKDEVAQTYEVIVDLPR